MIPVLESPQICQDMGVDQKVVHVVTVEEAAKKDDLRNEMRESYPASRARVSNGVLKSSISKVRFRGLIRCFF